MHRTLLVLMPSTFLLLPVSQEKWINGLTIVNIVLCIVLEGLNPAPFGPFLYPQLRDICSVDINSNLNNYDNRNCVLFLPSSSSATKVTARGTQTF